MTDTWPELFARAAEFELQESQVRTALREHRKSSDRRENEQDTTGI